MWLSTSPTTVVALAPIAPFAISPTTPVIGAAMVVGRLAVIPREIAAADVAENVADRVSEVRRDMIQVAVSDVIQHVGNDRQVCRQVRQVAIRDVAENVAGNSGDVAAQDVGNDRHIEVSDVANLTQNACGDRQDITDGRSQMRKIGDIDVAENVAGDRQNARCDIADVRNVENV
jgi:hypothetical protein